MVSVPLTERIPYRSPRDQATTLRRCLSGRKVTLPG